MNDDIGHSIGHESGSIKDNSSVALREGLSRNISAFLISDILAVANLKIEKLASAVYLVSGLLSDNEPIKWSIRKSATDILSDINYEITVDVSKSNGHRCPIENISSKIFQITSTLRVAWIGGLVSKMNYEILTSEYIKLNDFLIKNFRVNEEQKQVIKESFFDSKEITSMEDKINSRVVEKKYLGEEFLISNISEEEREPQLYSNRNFIKDISSKGHLSDKKDFVLKNIAMSSVSKTRSLADIVSGSVSDRNKRERHEKILSAMSPGISYSVSEIIGVIGKSPDTSEKTIQRDLQLLVSMKRLKKTGERRWSRYSLS
ncbi:MAG: hypothetical protein UT05_C0006G0015 [Parcubacteria group bacterium GW2011_GWF2_38_76]|nr:MAG: hypothetical protein UT05_C0006G0015 [Parcubacteria group bacterium GW2011_GWF2_38_76]HBM45884.1 hypothetical protein [Patescibacteria group bacterium]